MKSLLVRIFFAMVATNALAALGVMVVYGGGFDRHRAQMGFITTTAMSVYGAQVAAQLEAEGQAAANDALDRLSDETGFELVLARAGGEVLASARQISGEVPVARLAAAAAEHGGRWSQGPYEVATVGPDVVMVGHRPPHSVELSPPTFQLVLVILLAAVVSLVLSRWLASPLRALRVATRRLATGPSAVRVLPGLSRFADGEVTALAGDFDLMAERIEALLEARERLLRDVSHELRSPLARLTVALELARERAGEGAQSLLDRIAKEADRLSELIALVLTMAKLDQAPGLQDTSDVALDELVDEITGDAEFEAASMNRQVLLHGLEPAVVRGNPEILRQAVENVVRNALRWTPEGSAVEVTLEVRTEGAGRVAHVQVADRGPGVPDEALEEIFLPFTRVEAARDRASGGAGLGLAITSRAVRLHGGRVWATQRKGGGLVVTLALPVS